MTSREDARAFVDQWRRAGAALRHVEREELQHVDVAVTIRAFSGAVAIAAAADAARDVRLGRVPAPRCATSPMNELIETAHQACDAIAEARMPHCTIFTGFGIDEERAIELLTRRFRPRLSDAAGFARAHRVLLVESSNGIGIDVSLGGLPFESAFVKRATPFDFGDGRPMPTCSAEDLVVLKAFAIRTQDWADIDGVCLRQGSRLSWPAIIERLAPLAELKDDPTIMEHLARIRRESAG